MPNPGVPVPAGAVSAPRDRFRAEMAGGSGLLSPGQRQAPISSAQEERLRFS